MPKTRKARHLKLGDRIYWDYRKMTVAAAIPCDYNILDPNDRRPHIEVFLNYDMPDNDWERSTGVGWLCLIGSKSIRHQELVEFEKVVHA